MGCVYTTDSTKDKKLNDTLVRISDSCKNKCISDGSLSAKDGGDGVTLLSTYPVEEYSTMNQETTTDLKFAFQSAESIFVEQGKRVSQNQDATIVLLVEQ
jgi:hypothetical protein